MLEQRRSHENREQDAKIAKEEGLAKDTKIELTKNTKEVDAKNVKAKSRKTRKKKTANG